MISSQEINTITQTTLKIMLDNLRKEMERTLGQTVEFITQDGVKFKNNHVQYELILTKKKPVITNNARTMDFDMSYLSKQKLENLQYKFHQYRSVFHTLSLLKKSENNLFLDTQMALEINNYGQQTMQISP